MCEGKAEDERQLVNLSVWRKGDGEGCVCERFRLRL